MNDQSMTLLIEAVLEGQHSHAVEASTALLQSGVDREHIVVHCGQCAEDRVVAQDCSRPGSPLWKYGLGRRRGRNVLSGCLQPVDPYQAKDPSCQSCYLFLF